MYPNAVIKPLLKSKKQIVVKAKNGAGLTAPVLALAVRELLKAEALVFVQALEFGVSYDSIFIFLSKYWKRRG